MSQIMVTENLIMIVLNWTPIYYCYFSGGGYVEWSVYNLWQHHTAFRCIQNRNNR